MEKLIAACKALVIARDEWDKNKDQFPSPEMLNAMGDIEDALNALGPEFLRELCKLAKIERKITNDYKTFSSVKSWHLGRAQGFEHAIREIRRYMAGADKH